MKRVTEISSSCNEELICTSFENNCTLQIFLKAQSINAFPHNKVIYVYLTELIPSAYHGTTQKVKIQVWTLW